MALLLRASISTLLEHPFCKENTRAKTDGELSGSLPEAPTDIRIETASGVFSSGRESVKTARAAYVCEAIQRLYG